MKKCIILLLFMLNLAIGIGGDGMTIECGCDTCAQDHYAESVFEPFPGLKVITYYYEGNTDGLEGSSNISTTSKTIEVIDAISAGEITPIDCPSIDLSGLSLPEMNIISNNSTVDYFQIGGSDNTNFWAATDDYSGVASVWGYFEVTNETIGGVESTTTSSTTYTPNGVTTTNVVDYGYSITTTTIVTSSTGSTSTKTTTVKQPEIRTDCTETATTHANNVKNVMTFSDEIKSKMATIADYAKNNSNEYGVVVNCVNGVNSIYDYNGKGGIQTDNLPRGMTFHINSNSILENHSHTNDPNAVQPLSWIDIKHVGYASDYVSIQHGNTYYGLIASANDGSQYLAYVEDKNILSTFYQKYASDIKDDGTINIKSDLGKSFKKVRDDLTDQGYSKDDAQCYAMAYTLDIYNAGIKLYKKAFGSSDFKEMKTSKGEILAPDPDSLNNLITIPYYQPSICPEK